MGIAWAYICKFTSFPINHQTGLADNFFSVLLLLMATPIQAHRHAIFPHLLFSNFSLFALCSLRLSPESVNGTTCSHSEILYRYSDFSLQDIPAYFVEFLAAVLFKSSFGQ